MVASLLDSFLGHPHLLEPSGVLREVTDLLSGRGQHSSDR